MEENLITEFKPEIREALFDVAEAVLQTKECKIRIEPGSKKGDNFLGIVYRATCSTEDESNATSVFVKMAPEDETKRMLMRIHECFIRERYVYEAVLPFFREFQESRDVCFDGFNNYAKCYKSIDTEPMETMFFEDMVERDFIMINQSDITFEHILLVMKALGRFHAVSFALKDQEPDKFDELANNLEELFFTRGGPMSAHVIQAERMAIDCITDDNDVGLLEAILRLYEQNQYDQLVDLANGNGAEPYAVVLHGDLWSNNTMFRYNEANNTVMDVCFIDWQITRCSSPVLDLMYYIFSCTTRELRGRNYNIYLRTYHESLSNLLLRLGSDPEKLFPYSALEEQLQKFGKFGLFNATFILPVITKEIEMELRQNIDVSKQMENEYENEHEQEQPQQVHKVSDTFKKRFRDIARDMQRLGYI